MRSVSPAKPAGIFAAALGVALLCMLAFYAMRGSANKQALNTMPYAEQVRAWSSLIRERGGAGAYREFAASVEGMVPSEKHQRAHAFGEAAFQVEGSSSLATCDERFSYGCLHQVVAGAIASSGLDDISVLNEACDSGRTLDPLACEHGIGHGILSALGYDEEALDTALEICRTLPARDGILGCYGGIFMEYNVRTMLAADSGPRPLNDDLFAPCDLLLSPYDAPCFFWLPQWWVQAIFQGRTDVTAFARMGAYCESLVSRELSDACFGGIGNIVSHESGFDPMFGRDLCAAASMKLSNRRSCLASAARIFRNVVSVEGSEVLCSALPESEAAYCNSFAENIPSTEEAH